MGTDFAEMGMGCVGLDGEGKKYAGMGMGANHDTHAKL